MNEFYSWRSAWDIGVYTIKGELFFRHCWLTKMLTLPLSYLNFYCSCVRICGTIRKHLKKTRTDTQMKFYKIVARPTLLYGSETWVTTTRDMTGLEAAEM